MTTETKCRSCGGSELELVLSLGQSPLANALLTPAELSSKEETFPLDLVFCPSCTLLQITETVAPEKLFREYLYFSSFSDTMVKHAEAIANRVVDMEKLGAGSLAMEIASNDGYLLQHYKKRGVPVLGIEPARNVAKVAEAERGIRTISEFFGRELAKELAAKGERADVLHAHNVLAHVADLNGVIAGFRTVLKDRGVLVVEAPYAKDLIDHCEFDTIYHEHLCYFSLTALDALMDRHDLVVRDVERIDMHGGSLRIFVSRKEGFERGPRVRAMLDEERAWGVASVGFYKDFAKRVDGLKRQLTKVLAHLKKAGCTVGAYGAAAKATTLLNYFGIGADTVAFIADRSTYKQGRYIPGCRVPIVAPEELLARKPDYCLLTTWNFAKEILAQQSAYREAGGTFIVPIPDVRLV